MRVLALVLLASLISARRASADETPDMCALVAGAVVIADDGKFLGTLKNQHVADSILNEYGSHGSPYGSESILESVLAVRRTILTTVSIQSLYLDSPHSSEARQGDRFPHCEQIDSRGVESLRREIV